MAIYQIGDDAPELDATAWVADSAQVLGRVPIRRFTARVLTMFWHAQGVPYSCSCG